MNISNRKFLSNKKLKFHFIFHLFILAQYNDNYIENFKCQNWSIYLILIDIFAKKKQNLKILLIFEKQNF